jgi:hypothetical protein
VKSWSVSRYRDWLKCNAYFKYKHIDKLPEEKGPAMERGNVVHKQAEDYIQGHLKQLPPDLGKFRKAFNGLRKRHGKDPKAFAIEQNWGFTAKWEATAWDNWSACWLRVKVDLVETQDAGSMALVTDWKTGKYRDNEVADYAENNELYSLATLIKMPKVELVSSQLVFTDAGVIFPPTNSAEIEATLVTRDQLPELVKKWDDKVAPMFRDTRFAPKANPKCVYCSFSASKGGPCKF